MDREAITSIQWATLQECSTPQAQYPKVILIRDSAISMLLLGIDIYHLTKIIRWIQDKANHFITTPHSHTQRTDTTLVLNLEVTRFQVHQLTIIKTFRGKMTRTTTQITRETIRSFLAKFRQGVSFTLISKAISSISRTTCIITIDMSHKYCLKVSNLIWTTLILWN